MASRNFCSSCGTGLDSEWAFCGNCGVRVPVASPKSAAQQIPSLPISPQEQPGVRNPGTMAVASDEFGLANASQPSLLSDSDPESNSQQNSDWSPEVQHSALICSSCGKELDYKICKYCGGDAIGKGAQSPASVSFKRHFSNHTVLRQRSTGRLKVVKNGFNWYLLLYPQVFAFFYRLVAWGLIWWAIFIAWAAIDGFPFSLCFILQAVLAVFLAIKGNEGYIAALRNSGWIVVDPASLSEEQVSLLKTGDVVKKLLMAFVAYKAVEGMAKAGTGIVKGSASAFTEGLQGLPASTGNAARDVAIAEKRLAEVELKLNRGSGKYEDVLEAKRVLAHRKEKLYR